MRLVTLARVAAEAEALRLRCFARRQAMRGVWGAVAAVFGLFLLVMLHITIVAFLLPLMAPGYAALILMGLDAMGVAVFGIMAAHGAPGADELEAEAISRSARARLKDSMTTAALMLPVVRVAGKGVRGAVVTAVSGRLLRMMRRK